MYLKIKHIVTFITLLLLQACGTGPEGLSEIHGKQLPISPSLPESDSVEHFIAPYRNHLNRILDSSLAYAPYPITKTDGQLNTTAGNLMADIVLWEAGPVYESRTGNKLDFVLLNYGGIRSPIARGPVTARTAYEVMPFENSIVVVSLRGNTVRSLIDFLVRAEKPHPIAGLQIILDQYGKLQFVNIQGKPFDEAAVYHVGTSNYLVSGGDNMEFFRQGLKMVETDYLIRNAMIDYFGKVDTLNPKVDNRFFKIKGR